MTAPTAPTTPGTSTDVAALVDGAFRELECVIPTERAPHGGDVAAHINVHGCLVGWMCKNHLDVYLEWLRVARARRKQIVICDFCGGRYPVEHYANVQVF